MTDMELAVINKLKLANNGVTLAQTLRNTSAEFKQALASLVESGKVVKTTRMMYGFGLMPAYKLA